VRGSLPPRAERPNAPAGTSGRLAGHPPRGAATGGSVAGKKVGSTVGLKFVRLAVAGAITLVVATIALFDAMGTRRLKRIPSLLRSRRTRRPPELHCHPDRNGKWEEVWLRRRNIPSA
jgi:hypothetical protein